MPVARNQLHARRGGFTFIEVMFAVLIMGFGVIMIAAMLPVALRTTQNTRESTAGSAALEGAFHVLETGYALRTPAAGDPYGLANGTEVITYPAHDAPFNATLTGLLPSTLGDRISSADPRSAWVPFYYQDIGNSPKVTLVALGVRNVPTMVDATAAGFLRPGQFFTSPDNCPLPVTATLTDNATTVGGRVEQVAPNTIALAERGITAPQVEQAAVEGAAVVLRDGRGVLRVLRLSKPTADPSGLVWELAPGGDFTSADLRTGAVNAYLVGRMLQNPGAAWNATNNKYVGPSQVTQVLADQTLHQAQ